LDFIVTCIVIRMAVLCMGLIVVFFMKRMMELFLAPIVAFLMSRMNDSSLQNDPSGSYSGFLRAV
jgi:hypothetical protein